VKVRFPSRLLLLALAAVAPGLAEVSGFCQTSVVPAMIRANGHAESIGDILFTCTPVTGSGIVDVSVTVGAMVTSRVLTPGPPAGIEALLLINEPGASASFLQGIVAPTQIGCDSDTARSHTCPAGTNVVQGEISNTFGLTFHAPIDGSKGLVFPGVPAAVTILRITNIRVDANAVPAGLGGVGQLQALISFSGDGSGILLNNGFVIVGLTQSGASFSLMQPDLSGPLTAGGLSLNTCVPLNRPLALDPASSSAPDGVSFVVRIGELFASAFKTVTVTPATIPPDVNTRPGPTPQNIPGQVVYSETNFFNPDLPSAGNMNLAGLATQATRFIVRFTSPPAGLQVHAPVYENGRGPLDSRVRLIATSPDGSSPTYTPLGPLSSLSTYFTPTLAYVYEVTARNQPSPVTLDTIDLPFYLAHTGASYVTPGLTTVNVSFAPTSNDFTPYGAWVPRFRDDSTTLNVAGLAACPAKPALKAVIASQSGPANARVWQLGINNYGTGAAVNARVTSLSLKQTAGAACTPVVASGLPSMGDVAAGSTVNGPVTIDFTGCPTLARFTAAIGFAADNAPAGTSIYNNLFR
jgi:hypothetical protein